LSLDNPRQHELGVEELELAELAVRHARRSGADEAEAYVERRLRTMLELRDGAPEVVSTAAARGLALRVLVNGATGYASTSGGDRRGLPDLARRAVALASVSSSDPLRGLGEPRARHDRERLELVDPGLAQTSLADKLAVLARAEAASREEDARVRSTEVARYVETTLSQGLANSRGFAGRYARTMATIALTVVAEADGESLSGYGYTVGRGPAALDPGRAGWMAARRASLPIGGRQIPTQRTTVLFEPEVASGLLSQIALALSAEAVLKGRSMFAGKLGQRVGSSLVTLVDQGDLPEGLVSAPFDDEGVPTGRTALVERGVLRGFLQSVYTARRLDVEPTGNAMRMGYRQPPEVTATNFALRAEPTPRAKLLAETPRALLALTTRNVGGINPVNGDFSVGAAGVWLEHGEPTQAVSGVTLAANMHDLLAELSGVGDDFRWAPTGGAIGSGTLRIDGVMIGGT
jgi:PmbA protein